MAEKTRKTKRKVNFRRNFSLYYKFARKYKWTIMLLMFIIILFEGVRTAEKFLFKVIVDRGTEFSAGTLAGTAFAKILIVVAAVYIGMTIFNTVGRFFRIHILNRVDANLIADIRKKFFNHIVDLSHKFHTTHKTGSLISRLGRGARAAESITDTIIFNILPIVLQIILVGGSILYFSTRTAIVAIVVVSVFIYTSIKLNSMQQTSRLLANKAEDREKGTIGDVLTNIDSVKYFGKEDLVKRKYLKLSDETKNATIRNWDYYRVLGALQSVILGVGLFLLIYFPLVEFLNGAITLGTVVFIYTVYGNLKDPLFGFVHGIRSFYTSLADIEDLFAYDKIKNEIKDKPNAKDLKIREGSVEFKDMSFKYHKRDLFKNFNLKIKKNEKVAFVGPSGCGKTTLIKLLNRFYDVKEGEVLIDGKNIKNYKQESIRSETGIVPQECVLFDDTVYNNIKFSNPSASRKEVMDAIKFAQLDKIIDKFPRKDKTIVGERGVKLSGGEKQRVSIARALLANKKIIILDEATSALDSETEHEIQKDLEKLLENRTSIIVAHRLSTIMKADKIVVLENGKIVQIGKHKDLIGRKGLYKKLWNMQKGGYIK